MNLNKINFHKLMMKLEFINLILLGIFSETKFNLYTMIFSLSLAISFFVYKIICKEKLNINKIDILIYLFPFTYLISLFTYKSATFAGNFKGFLFSMSLLSIYFVIRNIRYKEKTLKYIINSIIIVNVIYIIVGIDIRTSKITNEYLTNILGMQLQLLDVERFNSIIGYINANAIFMLIAYMSTLFMYFKSKSNIKKYLYLGISNVFFSFFILTYSKATILLAVFILLVSIIIEIKEKIISKDKIINIIINHIIFSLPIITLYDKFYNSNNKLAIWVLLITYVAIFCFLAYILKYVKLRSNKVKKIFKIICVFVVITIQMFIILDIFNGSEVVINNNKTFKKVDYYNYTPGEVCNLEFIFEINDANENDNKPLYSIVILKQDMYNVTTEKNVVDIYQNDKTKRIDIRTDEDTSMLVISIVKLNNDNSKLTIKKCIIDGRKRYLNYNIIPTKLVNSIEAYLHKTMSVSERMIGMKDGIRIGLENVFTGSGDGAWKFIKLKSQTYNYVCSDVHCYPIVILIENGIIGIIIALSIIALLIYYFIRNINYIKKNKMNISIELLFLTDTMIVISLHALVDFDLSDYSIKILFIELLALYVNLLIKYKYENETVRRNKLYILLLFTFIINLINILFIYPHETVYSEYQKIEYSNSIININSYNKILDEYENYIKYEPYIKREIVLNKYSNVLKIILNNDLNYNNEEIKKYIDDFYDYSNIKIYKWNIPMEINRLEMVKEFSQVLIKKYQNTNDEYYKYMYEKYKDIVDSNYNELMNDAKNYKAIKTDKQISMKYIEKIEKLKIN